jgi:hypothetical protein
MEDDDRREAQKQATRPFSVREHGEEDYDALQRLASTTRTEREHDRMR